MVKEIIKNNNFVISKSNDLIEAKYHLTLMEQKFILLMASIIHPKKDKDFSFYRVAIKDIMKNLNLESSKSSYSVLRKLVIGLNRKSLVIPLRNGDELISTWVASAQYIKKKGYIEFEFSEKLKPYFLELNKRFTKLQFSDAVKLTSSYSIRLYELISQFKSIGFRQMKVDDLREILGLKANEELGITKDKYLKYGHFKSRVIEVAKKELRDKCSIYFDYEEISAPGSRKIESIKFIILQKKYINPDNNIESVTENDDLIQTIKEFGISQSIAEKIIENKTKEEIISDVKYINKNKTHARNLGAYALTIFNNREMPDEEIKEKKNREIEQQKQDTKRLDDDYELYIDGKVNTFKERLSDDDLTQIQNLVKQELQKKIKNKVIKKNRFNAYSIYEFGIEKEILLNKIKYQSKKEFLRVNKNKYTHAKLDNIK